MVGRLVCPLVEGSSSTLFSWAHLTTSARFRAGSQGSVSGRLLRDHRQEGAGQHGRGFPLPYLSGGGCQVPLRVVGLPPGGGLGARVRGGWSGLFARGRPALLRSTTLGLAPGSATRCLMGCSRWGKRCGRSIFLGRPRERVGSSGEGASRGASVSEDLTRASDLLEEGGHAATASGRLWVGGRLVLRVALGVRRGSSGGGASASSPSSRSVW
jgi:hypothetical protein